MGAHGFCIDLSAEWQVLVARSGLTQEMIDRWLNVHRRRWLDVCGFDHLYDPDALFEPYEYIKEMDPESWRKKLGPNARPLYDGQRALDVRWGRWGPEHISVPGNACGLDIERYDGNFGSAFGSGTRLLPHNIDSWSQKQLFLITFAEIVELVHWRTEDPSHQGCLDGAGI